MRLLGFTSLFGALLLGLACGDTTAGSADSDTCPVGSVTCPCTSGGACDTGLVCLSNLCVDPGGGESTQATPTSTGTSAGPGSVSDSEATPTTEPGTSTGTTGPVDPGTSTGGDEGPKLDVGLDTTTGLPVEGCRKIDMLFVLDGSGSMSEERQALSAINAFTDIVTTLANLNGEIDYRIAVTTDNDDGYVNPNNCWDQPNKWIDSEGNTPPTSSKAFNCAVSGFGNNTFEASVGCEHVLSSAADLLTADKSGFIRKDALLVLVMVTDVDDYGAYDQMNGNNCGIGCATPPPPLPDLVQKLVAVKNDDIGGRRGHRRRRRPRPPGRHELLRPARQLRLQRRRLRRLPRRPPLPVHLHARRQRLRRRPLQGHQDRPPTPSRPPSPRRSTSPA
jgi:hypothetical protein